MSKKRPAEVQDEKKVTKKKLFSPPLVNRTKSPDVTISVSSDDDISNPEYPCSPDKIQISFEGSPLQFDDQFIQTSQQNTLYIPLTAEELSALEFDHEKSPDTHEQKSDSIMKKTTETPEKLGNVSDHRQKLFDQQEDLINVLKDISSNQKTKNIHLASIAKSLERIANSKDKQ